MTVVPQSHMQATTRPAFTRTPHGLLQRASTCGKHTTNSAGECQACKQKGERTLQRAWIHPSSRISRNSEETTAPERQLEFSSNFLNPTAGTSKESNFEHDFSRTPVPSNASLVQRKRRPGSTARSGSCTSTEVSRTIRAAETARTASVPWIQQAQVALNRLHGHWIDQKNDLLAGNRTLSGEVLCAFNSNFNISPIEQEYGVRQISVMSRLRQLERAMSRAVPYECQPNDDPICVGTDRDTVAYVRGNRPPIYFCSQFRNDVDTINQQSTVVHEYAHLLPGVRDQGGYALGGFGAQVMTCNTNFKFQAGSDVLVNTADALAGFVMHIGQTDAADIHVR